MYSVEICIKKDIIHLLKACNLFQQIIQWCQYHVVLLFSENTEKKDLLIVCDPYTKTVNIKTEIITRLTDLGMF